MSRQHNGYELEKVFPNIKVNLLSNYFDLDVWQEIIRLRKEEILTLPQILLNSRVITSPIIMVAETGDYRFDGKVMTTPANEFHPEITKLSEKNNYHGYWINKHWFSSYREEMMRELRFPKLTGLKNIQCAKEIQNSLSVGVHIRRGDFIHCGWALPPEYYRSSCKKILEYHPECHFFVASDDLPWCQEHETELGLDLSADITYLSGNMNGKITSICSF